MLETNTDPDPDPDPDPIRIQGFNDQKLEKKLQLKIFIYFFFIKNCNLPILGLHRVCPSYRRSFQFSKEAIQHFKTWTFTNYCLLLWVIFAPPGSGTGSGFRIRIRIHRPDWIRIQSGSGSESTTLLRFISSVMLELNLGLSQHCQGRTKKRKLRTEEMRELRTMLSEREQRIASREGEHSTKYRERKRT